MTLKTRTVKVYAYPIKHKDGSVYYGTYSIKDTIKPLGYEGEFLLQTRTTYDKVEG